MCVEYTLIAHLGCVLNTRGHVISILDLSVVLYNRAMHWKWEKDSFAQIFAIY